MNRFKITVVLFFIGYYVFGQENTTEWSANFNLRLSDFQNPETEINEAASNVFIQSGATIELAFQMNNLVFMFKKNFNKKITCNFHRGSAILIAPDSTRAKQLLRLAQFDFDLSELYARKIRKEIYENKKTFSNSNFFETFFNNMIGERNKISGKVYKDSDFGNNAVIVEQEHELVRKQIEVLSDFCKMCKPSKKNK